MRHCKGLVWIVQGTILIVLGWYRLLSQVPYLSCSAVYSMVCIYDPTNMCIYFEIWAIFVPTTATMTKLITLPLVHARGITMTGFYRVLKLEMLNCMKSVATQKQGCMKQNFVYCDVPAYPQKLNPSKF